MTVSNLSAKTLTGEYYTFSLADVPVMLDDIQFVLMAKPNSPILLIDTVITGMDIDGLFEGSIISDGSDEYVVSFKRGFAAMRADRTVRKLTDFASYTNTGKFVTKDHAVQSLCRQRILYKANGMQFQIKDIIGTRDGKLVIRENYTSVDTESIQQYAGISHNGKKVFLGDEIDGSAVRMYMGRICIIKENKIFDLADNTFIEVSGK